MLVVAAGLGLVVVATAIWLIASHLPWITLSEPIDPAVEPTLDDREAVDAYKRVVASHLGGRSHAAYVRARLRIALLGLLILLAVIIAALVVLDGAG